MEFVSFETMSVLVAVAILAGWVDAIAGGGGLLVVPVLLWAGIPPAQALGTNKLQSSFGTCAAAWNYFRNGLIDLKSLRLAIGCTFIGGAAGSVLVQSVHPDFLYKLIPPALVAVAIYFICLPSVGTIRSRALFSATSFALVIGSGLGFYDGLIGPGTGSFFAVAFVALLGVSLIKATAHTKVLNLTSNVAALLFFMLGGNVLWAVGLTMAAGQMVGGYIGSHMAMVHGQKIIKPLIVVVSLALSLKIMLSRG